MKKKQIFLLSIVALLISMGCSSIPYDRGSSLRDEKLLALLVRKVKGLYPGSFRTVHRVILNVRGREFVFEGYVLVKKPDRIRLLAKSSLGGTAFDIAWAQGKVSLLQNPGELQPSWIKEGALRDVSALYLTSWLNQAVLVRHRSGAVGLAWERPDGLREEFLFEGPLHQLAGYFRARGDQCLYRIEFSNSKSSEDLRTIRVTDWDLGYHLTIQVLELEDSELDDELFERKP